MTVLTGPARIVLRPTHSFGRIPFFNARTMVSPVTDTYEAPSPPSPKHPIEDFASAIAQGKWDRADEIITDCEFVTAYLDLPTLAPKLTSAFQSTADTTLEDRIWMVRLALSLVNTASFFASSPAVGPLTSVLENALIRYVFAAAPRADQQRLFDCCNSLQRIGPFDGSYRTTEITAATSYAIGVFQSRFPDVPLDTSLHEARVAQETTLCTIPSSVDTLMQHTREQPAILRTTAWRVLGELMTRVNSCPHPYIQTTRICSACTEETPLSFRATRCTNESVSFCQSCFVQGIRSSTPPRIETECPCKCKQPLCYADFLLVGLSHQTAENKAIENLRQIFRHAPEWINCNNAKCSGGALRSQENIAPWNILQTDHVSQSACCLCQSDCGIRHAKSFDEHYIKRMLVSLGPWTHYFGTLRNFLDGVWIVPRDTGEHGIREAYAPELAGIPTEKGPDCEHMRTSYRIPNTQVANANWYWCSGAVPRFLLGGNILPELTWYLNDNCQLFLPERSPIIAPLGGYRVRDDHGDFISLYNPLTFVLDAQLYRTHALNFLLHPRRQTPLPPTWLTIAMGSSDAKHATTRHALIHFLEDHVPRGRQLRAWRPVHAYLLVFEAHVVRETYLQRSRLLETYKRHVRMMV